MNFFEHQELARKRSLLLGALFLLAVILIAASTNLIGYAVLKQTNIISMPLKSWITTQESLAIFGFITAVIAGGTIYQFIKLAKGGEAVAKMAKGRRLDLNTKDTLERRLINLVEEMSIASGTPMPDLYVMDNEGSINAFVAGYESTETVLVITRGAMERLSRDELQGVIGHEFSHILNGDMRINVRLIAILAGILLLGQIGQFLLRMSFSRSSYATAKKNRGNALLVLVGLGMVLIGYIGLFFGRLIKAAISRQREFLADAAAVQFTRNPEGIAGALYKILDANTGSRLLSLYHAEDINHLCFSESVKMSLSGLLASHPPLPQRIGAIDKSFLVRFKVRSRPSKRTPDDQPSPPATHHQSVSKQSTGLAGAFNDFSRHPTGTASTVAGVNAAQSTLDTVGVVSPAHVDYAEKLLASIPRQAIELAHSQSGAQIILLQLMLRESGHPSQATIAGLSERGRNAISAVKNPAIERAITAIEEPQRIPTLEIAIATLKSQKPEHKQALIQDLTTLARSDAKITFFEFLLITLVKQQLSAEYGKKIKSQYHSAKVVTNEVALIFKMFAMAATQERDQQQRLFSRAMRSFSTDTEWRATPKATAPGVSHALHKLRLLSPLLKRPLLLTCAECVMDDNEVKMREYELLRLVATVLDCPMPPLLLPPTA